MRTVTSWGRLDAARQDVSSPAFLDEARAAIANGSTPLLCYGKGRSYGDVCLNNNGRLVVTDRLDRFMTFDCERGIVRAEAGMTLDHLLRAVVPRSRPRPPLRC